MILNNSSVVIILLLLNYIQSVPEARDKCEYIVNNFSISSKHFFLDLTTDFQQSPVDDTMFFEFRSKGGAYIFEVYLSQPTIEDRNYNSTLKPGTNGTCLETRNVSLTTNTYAPDPNLEGYGLEFIEIKYQFERNARFDFIKSTYNCDMRKSSFKLPCHMGFLQEFRWYFEFELPETNKSWVGNMIPVNTTIWSLTLTSSKNNLYIVDSLNYWLGDLTKGIKFLNLSDSCLIRNANINAMPELTELYLRDCNLTNSFLNDYPQKFPNLQVLNIAGNDRIRIRNSFQNFSKLRDLDISYTILDLNPGVLQLPSAVKILRATNLFCTAYDTNISRYEEKFPSLQCSEEANVLIFNMLKQFTNLQTLILSYNNIKQIPPDSFLNLSVNAVVDLTDNKISDISSLHLKSLSLLDLTRNNISSTDHMNMDGSIERLNLSQNKIAKWHLKEVFNSESLHIKFVDLSDNKINAFSSPMLKSLSSLEAVDLGNNPIDCNDCSLKDFQTWLKDPRKKTVVTNFGTSYTTLKCGSPLALADTSILDAPYNESCDEITELIIGLSIPIPLLLLITLSLSYVFRFQLTYVAHMIRVRKRAKKKSNVDKKYEYDAFVSYSSVDRSWVFEKLLKTLESDDFKYALCLHERDFRLGKYIMDNVADCIEKSRHVIVVLTPNFIRSQWCQWELKLVQQFIFENNPEFLILVELQRLCRKDLPSTLRLLMCTRTYLECPAEGLDMSYFWRRVRQILGEPLAIIQPCNVENETECPPENIIDQMMEMYQEEINEILRSPESLNSETENILSNESENV